MATITQRVDDVDGKTAATHTVTIIMDGEKFTLDLSDTTFNTFKTNTEPFLKVAKRSLAAKAGNSDTAKIRAWAAENGIQVGARGTVPADVVSKYNAAQKPAESTPEAKPTTKPAPKVAAKSA